MMKKITWVILFVLAAVAVAGIYLIVKYEESETVEGFPVPRFAEIDEETNATVSYKWDEASFEDSFPASYRLMINLYAWNVVDVMGGRTLFEKNGRTVAVISNTNRLFVGEED